MKKFTYRISIVTIFTLIFGIFGFTTNSVVSADNLVDENDSAINAEDVLSIEETALIVDDVGDSISIEEYDQSVVVTIDGIFVQGVFYSQDEFEDLLINATYSETEYQLNQTAPSNGISPMAANPADLAGLLAGTWWIPGIGKVVVTVAGVVVVAGVTIKGGTWVYNKVKAYFAEKKYETAKKNGSKAAKHSNQSTSKGTSLSTKGTPLSSKDLKDSKGTKQRRYYDKNGNADLDIDYRHAGKYKFPHRHTWNNGKRSGH
ncbi:hypothetical protein [Mycobacteroides abscessus]|uniref:hypothetical protein n=1 Tax=unclassified Desemzia TaxID=2685243 RepID=UPI0009C9224C|nr:Uncharacterised protein [Mycobacteroides abscessus subsp. abscessus]